VTKPVYNSGVLNTGPEIMDNSPNGTTTTRGEIWIVCPIGGSGLFLYFDIITYNESEKAC
jgi:hypothetical protein